MSPARFRDIKRYLHLAGNTSLPPGDKMAELKPFFQSYISEASTVWCVFNVSQCCWVNGSILHHRQDVDKETNRFGSKL